MTADVVPMPAWEDFDSPDTPRASAAAVQPRRWRTAVEEIDTPPPETVIEGVCWSGCLTILAAESSAGKTFVLLDQAAAVSADLDWHGRMVRQGSAVYVGFEGHVGLRLRALREVAGHYLQHVYVVTARDTLSPTLDRDRGETASRGELDLARDLDQIVAHLKASGLPPVVLVQVDTVRASLAGSEDSSDTVSAYLRTVRRLMEHVPGAAWILAHHSGWQDSAETRRKRERGSSAFRGNVDGTLYLEAEEYDGASGTARLTLTTVKVRDGELPAPLRLVRRRVEVPGLHDRWDKPLSTCVIDLDRKTPEDRKAERAQAEDAEQRAFDLRVVAVIATRPELATSRENIRSALKARATEVREAVDRAVSRGWLMPPAGKRQPYVVTSAGTVARISANRSGGPESVPNRSGTDS